jgi:hypothetical protein
MKLASIAFAVAGLLAGCGSTTPSSPPPPSPAGSPAARVDPSAPAAHGVETPASSGDPAPSGSAASQPPPTADPELVRAAAALQFQADGVANVQAAYALPANVKHPERRARDHAELWGRYLAALRQLRVPADTTADLQDLIRKVTRVQAAEREASAAVGAWSWNEPLPEAWWVAGRHISVRTSRMVDAANRVRADLGLEGVLDQGFPVLGSYP